MPWRKVGALRLVGSNEDPCLMNQEDVEQSFYGTEIVKRTSPFSIALRTSFDAVYTTSDVCVALLLSIKVIDELFLCGICSRIGAGDGLCVEKYLSKKDLSDEGPLM